jgi:hypothetical protein
VQRIIKHDPEQMSGRYRDVRSAAPGEGQSGERARMPTSQKVRKIKNPKAGDPKAQGPKPSGLEGFFQEDVRKGEEAFFQEDVREDAEYPFYTLDPSTQHLRPLARNALRVEQVKDLYLCSSHSKKTSDAGASSPEEILKSYQSEIERFEWLSRDYLMRDIAHMIATGNWKGLKTIADIVGTYEASNIKLYRSKAPQWFGRWSHAINSGRRDVTVTR